MAYPRTIRNYSAFLDGVGYFGKCTKATLPAVKMTTMAHRGAGMDGPLAVDMGTEAMKAAMSFMEWAPELYRQFGNRPRLTLRPAAMGERDFAADAIEFEVGGKCSGLDHDELSAGAEMKLMLDFEVDYYRIAHNGTDVVEIDIERGIRKIGGVDQMAELRTAMGL